MCSYVFVFWTSTCWRDRNVELITCKIVLGIGCRTLPSHSGFLLRIGRPWDDLLLLLWLVGLRQLARLLLLLMVLMLRKVLMRFGLLDLLWLGGSLVETLAQFLNLWFLLELAWVLSHVLLVLRYRLLVLELVRFSQPLGSSSEFLLERAFIFFKLILIIVFLEVLNVRFCSFHWEAPDIRVESWWKPELFPVTIHYRVETKFVRFI